MAEIPKPPLIPIATLGASTLLLLISGVMMTIAANKIKDSPKWANDKEVQSIYVYAATAAGLALATFIIIALVSLLYLASGGVKTAKNTRAGRAESKSVLSFSPFLLGGIVVALLMTGIVGVLAIMTSSRLADVRADDEILSSAYTYAVISAIVTIGGIGTLIMALFGIVALRTYRKKALAKAGLVTTVSEVTELTPGYQTVSTTTYVPTSYTTPSPSTEETFPVVQNTTPLPTTAMTAPVSETTVVSLPPPVPSTPAMYYTAPVAAAATTAAVYSTQGVAATPAAYYTPPVTTPTYVTQGVGATPAAYYTPPADVYSTPVDIETGDASFPSAGEVPVSRVQKLSSYIPTQLKDTVSYVSNDIMTKSSEVAKQVYDQGSAYASTYVGSYLKPATAPL